MIKEDLFELLRCRNTCLCNWDKVAIHVNIHVTTLSKCVEVVIKTQELLYFKFLVRKGLGGVHEKASPPYKKLKVIFDSAMALSSCCHVVARKSCHVVGVFIDEGRLV